MSDNKEEPLLSQDQVIGFLQDIFSFERVSYSCVEVMARDVWTLAKQRHQAATRTINGSQWTFPKILVKQYNAANVSGFFFFSERERGGCLSFMVGRT